MQGHPNIKALMALLLTGVFMGALDLAIIGPALPAIQTDFDMTSRSLAWLFNLYVLGQLVGTPILAKLADRLGPRPVYIASILLFATDQMAALEHRLATLGTDQTLTNGRLAHWQDGWETSQQFLPLGSGLGTYGYVYLLHESSVRDEWFDHAHNQYLETLVDAGLPGLLIAAIFKFTVKEPPRGYTDPPGTASKDKVELREAIREMANGVLGLLEEINAAGTTIVMVTHDSELALRPPRNVHVLDGRIRDESEALGTGGAPAVALAAAPA